MEPPQGPGGIVKEIEVQHTALGVPAHGGGDSGCTPVAEEEAGIPIPAPGLLQVTERRRKYCDLPALHGDLDPTESEALGMGSALQHGAGAGPPPPSSPSKTKTRDMPRLQCAACAAPKGTGSSAGVKSARLWGDSAPRTFSEPLSSVSSLEVHFDLLDLTDLTDMSDQELAEVFADSDDENLTSESPAGLHPLPRAGCLRSPSWTRTRAEQNHEKQPLGDPERQAAIVDTFLTVEGPKED